jgi:hypothetical protein
VQLLQRDLHNAAGLQRGGQGYEAIFRSKGGEYLASLRGLFRPTEAREELEASRVFRRQFQLSHATISRVSLAA